MQYKFGLCLNERKFEYDIYSLLKAFFPEAEITIWYEDQKKPEDMPDAEFHISYQGTSVGFTFGRTASGNWDSALPREPWSAVVLLDDPADRISCKNKVKQLVYKSLRQMTGRDLPWGDLTGIRPTKIFSSLLEEGKTEEEILTQTGKTYFISEKKAALALETAERERRILAGMDAENGYSLYVGIPFCPSICLYCSFGSHPMNRFGGMVQEYLEALFRELRFISGMMKGRRLDTVYVGGGTPTSLTPDQLRQLLSVLQELFPMETVKEFTVEAGRPDTITEEKLKALREFPVSRISVNPQTMNQKTLDLIGRRHTVEETEEKFLMARSMGFSNINMDLIVGLPGEGQPEVERTLSRIRRLEPDSLTVHALALKRAARLNLFREEYVPVSFEASDAIMDRTAGCAGDMGMHPYYLYRQKNMAGNFENVGYAKEGKEGLYNILIMDEKQTIMAAGSGASTKFVFHGGRRIERVENVKDLGNYIGRLDEMLQRKREEAEKVRMEIRREKL